MKFIDVQQMRGQTPEKLQALLEEAVTHLQELRFQLASNRLSNVREYRKTRKQVARIKTVLRQQREETNE